MYKLMQKVPPRFLDPAKYIIKVSRDMDFNRDEEWEKKINRYYTAEIENVGTNGVHAFSAHLQEVITRVECVALGVLSFPLNTEINQNFYKRNTIYYGVVEKWMGKTVDVKWDMRVPEGNEFKGAPDWKKKRVEKVVEIAGFYCVVLKGHPFCPVRVERLTLV